MASTLGLPHSNQHQTHTSKSATTQSSIVQYSLKVPYFKASSPHDYRGRETVILSFQHNGHIVHSAVHQPYILCTEKKPGPKRNSGAAWHDANGTKKTSRTLCVNAGEQMKGHLQVGLFFSSPDCSNINIYVCIHTYAEYSSRQGGVYRHTHTQTQVFSKPNCQRGGFQVVNLDSRQQC